MKIGFCGAAGVGKTVLVDKFLEDHPEYNEPENISRLFNETFKNFGINEKGTASSQALITGFMVYSVMKEDNFIHSRTMCDTYAYARLSNMTTEECNDIEKLYEGWDNLYDFIFYIPIEFKMEEDGVRSTDEDYRKLSGDLMLKYLNENNIKYYTLTGTIEERYEEIKRITNAS